MRTSNSGQETLAQRRKRKAFGGRLSVAQALARAQLAVDAESCIEQRLARNDVRGTLATNREGRGVGDGGYGRLPQSSHGTSVLAPDRSGGQSGVCKFRR